MSVAPNESRSCGIVRGKYAGFLPRTKLPERSVIVARVLREDLARVQISAFRLKIN